MAFVDLVFLVCASMMMVFAPQEAYAAQVRVNWFSTHLFSTLSLLLYALSLSLSLCLAVVSKRKGLKSEKTLPPGWIFIVRSRDTNSNWFCNLSTWRLKIDFENSN
jgi:hypothetical protein